jgi:GAF domain
MPRFEVLVPAAPPRVPTDLALRVEADHWLGALRTGLAQLGETHPASHVICAIQADGSVHVTDPDSGRVFRILELPAVTPVAPGPAPRQGGPADAGAESRGPLLTPSHPIARIAVAVKAEDALADLSLEVAELGRLQDRQAGLGLALDTALRVIGCEAGTVFIADPGRQELAFEVVRGPAAERLRALGLKVPFGVGVAGFCAQENVGLAVSDAEQDPRFHRAVSEATGYQTRSLLCAPMARDGRVVGCLELVNKKGPRPFDQKDLAVLSRLAAQVAAFLGRVEG